MIHISLIFSFFFFNDTATTEIYTLSLHDALPISEAFMNKVIDALQDESKLRDMLRFYNISFHKDENDEYIDKEKDWALLRDRKSTRLNSSHTVISYAVFCLKKKKHRHCTLLLVVL